jgi:hypothetical protein
MSALASLLAAPPPDAAIEIASEGVSVAALDLKGRDAVVRGYAVARLEPGVVVPRLSGSNITDCGQVADAIRAACERAGIRPRRAALVIPDLSARVSLVRFERVPPRADDLEQLVRWQVKKSAPFPIEEACVTFSPGATSGGGREFVVVMARRDVVEEYEGACGQAGVYAGLVDLSTLSVVNLLLGAGTVPAADWLVVHMRPEYASIAVMRAEDLIFFTNRAEDDPDALADVVHQTAMYYQDRLGGQGFTRVFLGGHGRNATAVATARRDLEQRLATVVEPIESTRAATMGEGIPVAPAVMSTLAPLVGVLVRTSRETAHA